MIRILQILLLLALAWLIWRVVRNLLAARLDSRATPEFEPAARCIKCDTHVPRTQLDAAGLCARCTTKPK